jgi:hypothetical protein
MRPTKRRKAGIIWIPQGIRKAGGPWLLLFAPPSTKDAPYWMKYWIRIP